VQGILYVGLFKTVTETFHIDSKTAASQWYLCRICTRSIGHAGASWFHSTAVGLWGLKKAGHPLQDNCLWRSTEVLVLQDTGLKGQ
jgi:hypothetical protein